MFETIYSQIVGLVSILAVGFAFIKGDEPERLGAGAFALVSLATLFIPEDAGSGPMWGRMALDVVLLGVFVWLAWYSRRTWLFWAASFQAVIVTGHVLVMANIRPPINAFAAVNNLANYGLLISMAVGTFWAWQERRAAGIEK